MSSSSCPSYCLSTSLAATSWMWQEESLHLINCLQLVTWTVYKDIVSLGTILILILYVMERTDNKVTFMSVNILQVRISQLQAGPIIGCIMYDVKKLFTDVIRGQANHTKLLDRPQSQQISNNSIMKLRVNRTVISVVLIQPVTQLSAGDHHSFFTWN